MLIPKKNNYDEHMDPEMIGVCDALNCIPGVSTRESCCRHGKSHMFVSLRASDPEGLFFLARCVDRRYWRFGDRVKLEIGVGDCYEGMWPTKFFICGDYVKADGREEAESLRNNIIFHLNHKEFIKDFNIDLSRFDVEGEPCGDDWWEQIRNYET